MLTLGQESLLRLSTIVPFDHYDPILNDQLFESEMTKLSNEKAIRTIQNRIKRERNKLKTFLAFKRIDNFSFKKILKLNDKISIELFDNFGWKKITTKEQAAWKEYFHALYELLVFNDGVDHTCTLMLIKEVCEYHSILEVPRDIQIRDPCYPIISTLKHYFELLKMEQIAVSESVGDIKYRMNESLKLTIKIQGDIIRLQNEKKSLERDNKKLQQIFSWSIR